MSNVTGRIVTSYLNLVWRVGFRSGFANAILTPHFVMKRQWSRSAMYWFACDVMLPIDWMNVLIVSLQGCIYASMAHILLNDGFSKNDTYKMCKRRYLDCDRCRENRGICVSAMRYYNLKGTSLSQIVYLTQNDVILTKIYSLPKNYSSTISSKCCQPWTTKLRILSKNFGIRLATTIQLQIHACIRVI